MNASLLTSVLAIGSIGFSAGCTASTQATPTSSAPPAATTTAAAAAVKPSDRERAAGETAGLAHGKALFTHAWTKGDPLSKKGDGLGPNFNGSSCMGCHNAGGAGGAGGTQGNTFIFDGVMIPRESDDDDAMKRKRFAGLEAKRGTDKRVVVDQGMLEVHGPLERNEALRDLLDLVRPQVQPCFADAKLDKQRFGGSFKEFEVKLSVDGKGAVAGVPSARGLSAKALACIGDALSKATLPASGSAAPSSVKWTLMASQIEGPLPTQGQRNPTALFGAGDIDGIGDDVIIAEAAAAVPGHPEITGAVPKTDKGEVARFGWKGDVKNLDTFVARACALEVGLEVPGMHQYGFDDANAKGIDLDDGDVKDLTRFVRSLPRPSSTSTSSASTAAASPEAARGRKLFASAGCTACHREKVGDVDGIYSDLLLHDMGAVLADGGGYGGGSVNANDREWRTPPLWGVRDSGPWLHDGRAPSLKDAVMMHSGEASVVREAFGAMRADDQQAVVSFLESLQAQAL